MHTRTMLHQSGAQHCQSSPADSLTQHFINHNAHHKTHHNIQHNTFSSAGATYPLIGLNLETGAPQATNDAFWRGVVEQLALAPEQVGAAWLCDCV